METIVYENSMRAQCLVDCLRRGGMLSRYNRVHVLPIPSSRDGIRITGTDVLLDKFADGVGGRDLVICYGLPGLIQDRIASRGTVIADSKRDEGFLLDNARLTAEATLGILLSLGRKSLSDLRVGIVGYGRIGRELLLALLYLGSHVVVYTGRRSVMIELSSLGVSALDYGMFEVGGVDVVVNTAPSDVFYRRSGDALIAAGVPIIELASGDNFGDGADRGLDITKYPSLPSRVFPMSAGEVWARSVERLIISDSAEESSNG